LFIQDLIRAGIVQLASSYVLQYENANNPFLNKRITIGNFIEEYSSIIIDDSKREDVLQIAEAIMRTGVKMTDAFHISCAILAECDYFITTDDRVLKHKSDDIQIIDPIGFIKQIGGLIND
jgi:predicted nucleic acid-binding protein